MLKKARFERNVEKQQGSKSPNRRSPNKMSDSRPSSSKKKSPSPSRRDGSAKSRTSSAGKKSRSNSGKSKSPSPSRRGKSASSKGDPSSGEEGKRGRSAGKKKVRIKSADRTENGLKIRDLSDQGLTAIPINLLTEKELGIVNLSGNNLKNLPVEVKRWTTLEKLDLSKNYGLRRTKPNDFSSLPQEMVLLVNLRELVLSECNLQRLPPILWQLTNLHVLDISRNKINILVPEVGNLSNLRKINLKHTNITSLPPEIVYCQDLEEILLWGNKISNLPETLPELLKLRTLGLNYRDFCGKMDQFMESFLNTKQIISEYIPAIVFELPALESLDLEATKINKMPETTNHGLKELNLSRNFLQDLPISVYNLHHLTILDLTDNKFTSLPDAIGNVRSLLKLRLAKNQLHFLPTTIGKLVNLRELDISRNKLKRLPINIKGLKNLCLLNAEKNELSSLPNEICELTEIVTLNLMDNKIHTLPMMLHQLTKLLDAHVYDRYYKHGLWLYKNPLTQPPPEIWKTDSTEKIFDYLKKLAIIKTENLQRQRIIVIGKSGSGKTTLVNSLVHGKSLAEEAEEEKTAFIAQTNWKTENLVEFVINDFGGDEAYRMGYPLFLDSKALALLTYNHSTYNMESHQQAIGQWLDLLHMYAPGIVIKLVGTKTDLCLDQVVSDATTELVQTQVEQQLQKYQQKLKSELDRLQKEIKSLQSDQNSSDKQQQINHLESQKQRIEFLISNPIQVVPDISTVNIQEGLSGVSQLINSIELLAIDTKLFPHAQRSTPISWNKLRAKLKQQDHYFLGWEHVESLAEKYNIVDKEISECIQYLHDTGEVLWYKNIPGLSLILFHKPRLLVNIITSLYHHNFDTFLSYEDNKIFMSLGKFEAESFNSAAEIFLKYGQISRPLLMCFWFDLLLNDEKFTELLELIPLLDICYTIPEPPVPNGKNTCLPLMVLPWFNTEMADSELVESFSQSSPEEEKMLTITYQFPTKLIPGVFETLCSSLQNTVLSRIDWKNAVYASMEGGNFLLMNEAEEENGKHSKFTIRFKGEDEYLAELMIQKVTQVINENLSRIKGLTWRVDATNDIWESKCIS